MTICIAFNFEKYAILAADTRLTTGDPPISYDDNQPKVDKTDIGLITGAGLHELLVAVKRRYDMGTVRTSIDTQRVIDEERTRLLASNRYARDTVNKWLEKTGWLFTYQTEVDNIPTLRVAIIHGSIKVADPHVAVVAPNQCLIISPGDASIEESEQYRAYLCSNLRPLPPGNDASRHASYHIQLCLNLIRRASQTCRSVGPYMTYGLHILNGLVTVSERIPSSHLDPRDTMG